MISWLVRKVVERSYDKLNSWDLDAVVGQFASDAVLVFEYISIRKTADRFEYVPVSEFVVDVTKGEITERPLADPACLRTAAASARTRRPSRC